MDTRALPADARGRALGALRAALGAPDHGEELRALVPGTPDTPPAERALLDALPAILRAFHALPREDRAHAARVLETLTGAMAEALATFPSATSGRIVALESLADLDRYTYLNAGCVGAFWTDLVVAHRPRCRGWDVDRMRDRGVRFGQGLQLVNVLRDLPRDLRLGRCYLPRDELAALGLDPRDLLDPAASPRLHPLMRRLVGQALDHLAEGLSYTLALPRQEWRLRLACAWPLLIGLATLRRLASARAWLDPRVTVKVPRAELRRLLLVSGALVAWDRGLRAYAHRLARAVPR